MIREKALRTSGRFSETVATPAEASTQYVICENSIVVLARRVVLCAVVPERAQGNAAQHTHTVTRHGECRPNGAACLLDSTTCTRKCASLRGIFGRTRRAPAAARHDGGPRSAHGAAELAITPLLRRE